MAACRRFALLFKKADLSDENAKEAAEAFWVAASLIWRGEDYYWNEWADQMVLDFCRYRRFAILGAKQSGKSTTVMAVSLVLWWGAWKKCSIIYRTTTIDAAETRGWGEFIRLYDASKEHLDMPGAYKRAKPPKLITYEESGDKKHAILCLPTAKGSSGDGAGSGTSQKNMKGFHTEYQLLIDDELNEMPDGCEDSPAALDAEWKAFRYVGIGNPNHWNNPLGRLSTPSEMKRADLYKPGAPNRWAIDNGIAIRLNAYESPNILKGKLPNGEWPYKHLPTPGTIEIQLRQCGGEENHALMWQYIRALPPPDDATATILTYAMVGQFHADQPADFMGQPTMGAGLDPAFTLEGDDCTLRFARWGICRDRKWRVEYLDSMKIPITAEEAQDSFHHIAHKVIQACKSRGVHPSNFSFDCSGTGLGIKTFFIRDWSNTVHPCDSGGRPSKLKVIAVPSAQDIKDKKVTGVDCFDRRVSEIYFTLRYFVEHDQVRGLLGDGEVIINEATQRGYFSENGKLSVVSKKALYNKHASSDNLDAACVILDMLKHKGFLPGGGMADQASLQQQAENEIFSRTSPIPDISGATRQDAGAQAVHNILEKIGRNSMFNTGSGSGAENDYSYDETGLGGF